MNQTQVAALIAELNAMPAGLYSCDANGSACNSYVAQWKVVELVEKHAALAQQAQAPAPVDERAEFEAACAVFGWPATSPAAYWSDEIKDYTSNLLSSVWAFWQARAAFQSTAPQMKGQP